MNDADREYLAALLREAMPVDTPELETDLWPRMLRELERRNSRAAWWPDLILAAGALLWCVALPAAIPGLLFQL